MSEWLPFLVAAAMALLSVVVNVVLVAFFLGKTKATQDAQAALFAAYQTSQATLLDSFKGYLQETITSLRRELEKVGDTADTTRTSHAEINQRLINVERNVDGMARLREDLIRFGGRFEEHAGRTDETVESIRRELITITRLVAAQHDSPVPLPLGPIARRKKAAPLGEQAGG